VAIQNFLVTHEGVSNDTAYKMTKAIFDSLSELHAAHAAAKAITKENAAKAPPAPLHPGAEKYYKEVGTDQVRGTCGERSQQSPPTTVRKNSPSTACSAGSGAVAGRPQRLAWRFRPTSWWWLPSIRCPAW
jgi:hypothetical protein